MPTFPAPDPIQALPTVGQEILNRAAQLAHTRQPNIDISTELLRAALPYALREQIDGALEIVLGHRGRGSFHSLLLGSTALRVAGRTDGPVVITRGFAQSGQATQGEVLLGVDPFEDSSAALEYAFDAAEVRETRLRAVHAFQLPDTLNPLAPAMTAGRVARTAKQALSQTLAPWRQGFPQLAVAETVFQGHPVAVLADRSHHADLLVLGAHGHTALGGLLVGSISHGALHHTACPIAIIRPRQSP